jgi:hypothetical protein
MRCVISQKSADLVYFSAEAWKQTGISLQSEHETASTIYSVPVDHDKSPQLEGVCSFIVRYTSIEM